MRHRQAVRQRTLTPSFPRFESLFRCQNEAPCGVLFSFWRRNRGFARQRRSEARRGVRIPHPKIDKLACQAKGEGIFDEVEYPDEAPYGVLFSFWRRNRGFARQRASCLQLDDIQRQAVGDIHAFGVIWHDGLEISPILCYTNIKKVVGI